MIDKRNGRTVLITPVSADDLKGIHMGEIIYLDGCLTTCRDVAHRRVVEERLEMPVDVRNKAILHAGPIVRQIAEGQYEMVSVGPTTSMRMEEFEYDFVKTTGVRVIIGKGRMKDNAVRACKEFGCIYCVLPAGNAVIAALCVEGIEEVGWRDLGMPEALWSCHVKEFGPLIVAIDADGNDYFEAKGQVYERRKEEQLARIRTELSFIK